MYIKFVHSELQSLGIEYLSSMLKQHGHQTQLIVDPQVNVLPAVMKQIKKIIRHKESFIEKVIGDKPDIIAFSVTSYNWGWACALALDLKKITSIPIVFGGIQASLIPDEILNGNIADFVIVGEGEFALLELVQNLEVGCFDVDVKNVYFKKDGKIKKNPIRDLIEDLDVLPLPDKKILPDWVNRGLYRIITSRGCLGQCSYCSAPLVKKIYQGRGGAVRRRSVQNVIAELKIAKSLYGIRRVLFEDDLFTSDLQWVEEFAEAYKKTVGLPSLIHSTPSLLTEEMVKILGDMGCYCVELGIQSINQNIRIEVLHRNYTNEEIIEVVGRLKRYGINCICDNIIGLPRETEEDIIQLVNFYNSLRPGKIEILCLEYYPMAEIIQTADLEKETVGRINKGELVVSRGDNPNRINKILLLIGLSYILPKRLISFMLCRKVYEFFLPINDFNHFNEAIFYLSSLFKPGRERAFVPFRADFFYKIRYLIF